MKESYVEPMYTFFNISVSVTIIYIYIYIYIERERERQRERESEREKNRERERCCIAMYYNYTLIHAEYILTREDFFQKMYLSLYLKGLVCVRGSWRPNRTAIYWPPLLWPSGLCLSRSLGLLNRGGAEAPSAGWWLSLPHLVSNSSDLQLTDFLSLPSYIIVQSPTQSLGWHVWSSSRGNNCHAVHRSLSSGASLYECTIRFYLVPNRQPNPPTRFLLITAIGMYHFIPVHHFGMACLAGSKVNIQQRERERERERQRETEIYCNYGNLNWW